MKNLFRGAIVLAAFLVALSTSNVAAEIVLENRLSKSKEAITKIDQFCGKSGWRKLSAEYGSTIWAAKFDNIGGISPFGITSHGYFAEKVGESVWVLLTQPLSNKNDGRDKRCTTRLTLISNRKAVKLIPGFAKGDYEDNFNGHELGIVEDLLSDCKDMGALAQKIYPYGEYALAGDEVFSLEGGFSCDSAVLNNMSSVRVRFDGFDFRIKAIFGRVILEESK